MSSSNKTYNTVEEWKAAFTHHCVIKPKKMTTADIAQVAHEVNKAYCEAIGDNSQTSWGEAPAWQKESALLGVMFHVENPNAGPEASHNSWLKEKLENGWRLGHVKDANEKTHPCILPFQDLPKEQQAKDFLFRQVVHSLKQHLV
jgi:hypothetical protein